MTLFFLVLFLSTGVLNYLCTLVILRELAFDKPGTGFFDLRWHVLKNLGRYRDLTRTKYGRVGVAYHGYVVTLVLLIVSAALLLQSLGQ